MSTSNPAFVIDIDRRSRGEYKGLLDWLEREVGKEGRDYNIETKLSWVPSDQQVVDKITIYDPEKALLTQLRWG